MTSISSSTCIRCAEPVRSVCEGVVGRGGACVGLPGRGSSVTTGVPGEVGGKGPPRKGESTRSGSWVGNPMEPNRGNPRSSEMFPAPLLVRQMSFLLVCSCTEIRMTVVQTMAMTMTITTFWQSFLPPGLQKKPKTGQEPVKTGVEGTSSLSICGWDPYSYEMLWVSSHSRPSRPSHPSHPCGRVAMIFNSMWSNFSRSDRSLSVVICWPWK